MNRDVIKGITSTFPVLVFTILCLVYGFFYSGTFATDDEHVLASQTLSLSFDGEINHDRVIGNSRVFRNISIEESQNSTWFVEPMQAYMSNILVRLSIPLGTGRIQTIFLLNILATAAAAVLVYLTLKKLTFSPGVAFLTAILFGLGTIVFPYTKTYFRDSLAMFFIACASYFQVVLRAKLSAGTLKGSVLSWTGWAVSLMLGIFTKSIVLVAIPVFAGDLIYSYTQSRKGVNTHKGRRTKWMLIFALGLVIFIPVWFFGTKAFPVFDRISPESISEIVRNLIYNEHPHFFEAILGPFFSPGKSIFIYSPILLLGLFSLLRGKNIAIISWSFTFLLVIAQGLFFDDEWAGYVHWNLRFLIPAMPGLMLSAASTIDYLVSGILKKLVLVTISILSIGLQVLASIVPLRDYFSTRMGTPISTWMKNSIWTFNGSQLFWAFQWVFESKRASIALVRNLEAGWMVAAMAFLLLFLMFLMWVLKKKTTITILTVCFSVGLLLTLPKVYKNDPAWSVNRLDFRQAMRSIGNEFEQNDIVLISTYGTPIWGYWMNWCPPEIKWLSLTYQSPRGSSNQTEEQNIDIMEDAVQKGARIWLVVPSDITVDDQSFEHNWLSVKLPKSSCREYYSKEQSTKVCIYSNKQ